MIIFPKKKGKSRDFVEKGQKRAAAFYFFPCGGLFFRDTEKKLYI